MSAETIDKSCQEIFNCVNKSSLNYSVNLTPYSMYITVRKSLSKKSGSPKPDQFSILGQDGHYLELENRIKTLQDQLTKAEISNSRLRSDLEEAIADSEASYIEINFLKAKIVEFEDNDMNAKKNAEVVAEQLKNDNVQLLRQVKSHS